jgi:hypothetical protein
VTLGQGDANETVPLFEMCSIFSRCISDDCAAVLTTQILERFLTFSRRSLVAVKHLLWISKVLFMPIHRFALQTLAVL